MNLLRVILLTSLVCSTLRSEDGTILPGEAVKSVQTWLEQNVEDWVFDVSGIDRQAVNQSLNELQEGLNPAFPATPGTDRACAEGVLEVLCGFEETRPYALWLNALLDGENASAQPTKTAELANSHPSPRELREVWRSILTTRRPPAKAERYLTQTKSIFEAEDVPVELVWVAEVESAFDEQAKSPVGAVGLFQLMPDTAESLGLSIWLPDERRNADKNARAAAQYLRHLNDRFSDWQLVLAAYNAGPTRVSRLLRKSQVPTYEGIAHRLPAETRDYVAKVEATLLVREGIELASLPSRARPGDSTPGLLDVGLNR